MALFYHQTKLLTAKMLRHDSVANQIGYWKIKTKIRNIPVEFSIVRDGQKERYLVAANHPFNLLGAANSLEEAAQIYNNYAGLAYVPAHTLKRAHVYFLTTG